MDYSSSFTVPSTTNPGVTFAIHKPSHGRRVDFDRLNAEFRDRMRKTRKRSDAIRDEIQRLRDEFNAQSEKQLTSLKASPDADPGQIARLENGLEIERLRSILANVPSNTPDSVTHPILEQIVTLARNAVAFEIPAELRDEQQSLTTQITIDIEGSYKPNRVRWGLKSIDGLTIDGQPTTVETLLSDGPRELVSEIYEAVERVSNFTPEQLKNSQWPITSSAPVDGPKTSTTATSALSESTGADATVANSQS